MVEHHGEQEDCDEPNDRREDETEGDVVNAVRVIDGGEVISGKGIRVGVRNGRTAHGNGKRRVRTNEIGNHGSVGGGIGAVAQGIRRNRGSSEGKRQEDGEEDKEFSHGLFVKGGQSEQEAEEAEGKEPKRELFERREGGSENEKFRSGKDVTDEIGFQSEHARGTLAGFRPTPIRESARQAVIGGGPWT